MALRNRRIDITEQSRPVLARHAKLRFDEARQIWVVLVPERVLAPDEREAVCNALIFKTNVLWVQLDALYHAYVEGHVPPGAFVPNKT
jgi:pyrroloquinoline-quinone synthase